MTNKTPTHVICPDVPGLPSYLTAGKKYEVICAQRDGFAFRDNQGRMRIGMWNVDRRINYGNWIPVYADEDDLAEWAAERNAEFDDKKLPPNVMTIEKFFAQFDHVPEYQNSLANARAELAEIREHLVTPRRPTWADVGPGLLDALEDATQRLVEMHIASNGDDEPTELRSIYPNEWRIIDTCRAALAAAEKVK